MSRKRINKSEKIILVTGATGRQGGAVALRLQESGWRVRALVRNAGKPAARTLAWKGIELVQGDLNDRLSVERALDGVYGVFAVFSWTEGGVRRETEQGKMLANAARSAGIGHYIYSSVGGADRFTGIAHFDSKWNIEEHLRSLNIPATIFRPVFMMFNFNAPEMHDSISAGTLRMAMLPDRPLQMLAAEDLAAFTALAFENPEAYIGKSMELAGDELTMPQAADVFSRVLGRKVRFVQQPIEEVVRGNRERAAMMEWFNRHGYRADIAMLRRIHPGLMTLERWLRASGWVRKAA